VYIVNEPGITSAFLTYVDYHQVLPDIASFTAAVDLAHQAPVRLRDAKDVEDALCSPFSWNRAAWTMWGGVHGGPERGGREREDHRPTIKAEELVADDGGWSVETREICVSHVLRAIDHSPGPSPGGCNKGRRLDPKAEHYQESC
jgi:hypothetical protein